MVLKSSIDEAYEKAVASKDTGKFGDYLEVFIEKM